MDFTQAILDQLAEIQERQDQEQKRRDIAAKQSAEIRRRRQWATCLLDGSD